MKLEDFFDDEDIKKKEKKNLIINIRINFFIN